jgi:hypothetical protein
MDVITSIRSVSSIMRQNSKTVSQVYSSQALYSNPFIKIGRTFPVVLGTVWQTEIFHLFGKAGTLYAPSKPGCAIRHFVRIAGRNQTAVSSYQYRRS